METERNFHFPLFAVGAASDDPKMKFDLTGYFVKRPPGVLHCTTKFTDYGKAPGSDDYAQQEVRAFPSSILSTQESGSIGKFS